MVAEFSSAFADVKTYLVNHSKKYCNLFYRYIEYCQRYCNPFFTKYCRCYCNIPLSVLLTTLVTVMYIHCHYN